MDAITQSYNYSNGLFQIQVKLPKIGYLYITHLFFDMVALASFSSSWVQQSTHGIPCMALDQFHEQSIKGDSGIVGVIEDPSTIHRWMLAGLEITRVVTQFEELMGDVSTTTSHHEQTPYHQVAFAKDTNFVIGTFND